MIKEIYWEKALKRTKSSVKSKSLIPLKTKNITTKLYSGTNLIIRELDIKNFKVTKQIGPKVNPFKPWDKKLEISPVGRNHHLILNKYPVQLGHLLLITNDWKPQCGWLDREDWDAIKEVNNDTTGLWFFNSGPRAGASQPHRHFQLLRRGSNEMLCPRENWLLEFTNANNKNKKFNNKIVTKKFLLSLDKEDLYSSYLELSKKLDLGNPKQNKKPNYPYNILLTNRWISLIRRKTDNLDGISINALGFAGYILVTKNSNINFLKEKGPDKFLENFI